MSVWEKSKNRDVEHRKPAPRLFRYATGRPFPISSLRREASMESPEIVLSGRYKSEDTLFSALLFVILNCVLKIRLELNCLLEVSARPDPLVVGDVGDADLVVGNRILRV